MLGKKSSPENMITYGRWPVIVWGVVLLVGAFFLPRPVHADGPAGNLTSNWGMETWDSPYGWYPDSSGYPLQVASDWHRFPSSGTIPRFMKDTEYAKAFAGSGAIPRHLEGDYSQNLWSGHTFTGGLYQQIAVTPGTPYTAKSMMLTVMGTDENYPHTLMSKQVGLNPYGGTDPASSNVIWGEADDSDRNFVDVRTAARAIASTMTLFARVISPDESYPDWNAAFMETVALFQAPTVSASSPESSATTSFTVRWNNGHAAREGDSLLYYDVQVRDATSPTWTGWYTKATATQGAWTGQMGHTYYFRARAWEDYSGIKLYGVYAPDGDTHTTVGHVVQGSVQGNVEFAVSGATVAISGTHTSATTDGSGHYSLPAPAIGSYSLTVSAGGYNSPPPVPFTVQSDTMTIPISFTVRPPTEWVVNGDFEEELTDGWTTDGDYTPEVQSEVVRSGERSLALRRDTVSSGQSIIYQSPEVTAVFKPVLSFYARTEMGNVGDRLIVGRYNPTPPTYTPLLTLTTDSAWAHHWVLLDESESYSGPLGIYFQAEQAGSSPMQVHLDEVNVGKSPGGPNRVYLPIISK